MVLLNVAKEYRLTLVIFIVASQITSYGRTAREAPQSIGY